MFTDLGCVYIVRHKELKVVSKRQKTISENPMDGYFSIVDVFTFYFEIVTSSLISSRGLNDIFNPDPPN